jgi:hypothetical protein
MKSFFLLIVISGTLSCTQSEKHKQVAANIDHKRQDAITDPVTPVHYDIDYNPIVYVSPGIFPKGSTGIGLLRIFIDTTLKVKKFEILSASINYGRNEIYNYISDKEKRETLQLNDMLAELVKNVKIKKIDNPVLEVLETYDIAIRFK